MEKNILYSESLSSTSAKRSNIYMNRNIPYNYFTWNIPYNYFTYFTFLLEHDPSKNRPRSASVSGQFLFCMDKKNSILTIFLRISLSLTTGSIPIIKMLMMTIINNFQLNPSAITFLCQFFAAFLMFSITMSLFDFASIKLIVVIVQVI